MTTCKGCGRDMDRQSTHWEGCHEHHPECASYREGFKAGREAGMREAERRAERLKGHADRMRQILTIGDGGFPCRAVADYDAEFKGE